MRELIRGKDERKILKIVICKLNSLYGEYSIIRSFLDFVRKHRFRMFF